MTRHKGLKQLPDGGVVIDGGSAGTATVRGGLFGGAPTTVTMAGGQTMHLSGQQQKWLQKRALGGGRVARLPDHAIRDSLELDLRFLSEDGEILLRSAAEYQRFPRDVMLAWCSRHGFYLIPTIELVEWIHERIGGRTAIEICAGRSGLGRHLGIPMTDAFTMSEEANHQAKAVVTGAIPTIPGPDVERLEALEAVERYRPQVVIAAWATPYMPGEKVRKGYRGSAFGVREVELVGRCEEYLKIGTLSLNAHNPVRGLPHEEYRLPFVVGRVMKKNEERVWIWKGGRSR